MSDLDLDAIRKRADRALDEVGDICAGNHRWTMRIPAEPDRDSDLVISAALADVDALLTELDRLRANQLPDGGVWSVEHGYVSTISDTFVTFDAETTAAALADPNDRPYVRRRRVWRGPAQPLSDASDTPHPYPAIEIDP